VTLPDQEVRLSTPTIPSQFPELFEIERAFIFFLRTCCLLGRSSRLRLFSSAPIVGTAALLCGTPSPAVRIAELRFFSSFGLFAIARASKIQVDSIGRSRSGKFRAAGALSGGRRFGSSRRIATMNLGRWCGRLYGRERLDNRVLVHRSRRHQP